MTFLSFSNTYLVGSEFMGKVEPITYKCPVCGWTMKMPFNPEDISKHVKTHNDKITREFIRRPTL